MINHGVHSLIFLFDSGIKPTKRYIFIFPLFIIVIYVMLSVLEYVRMVIFNYFEINTIIDCMVRKIKKVFLNNKLLWHF